MFNDAGVLVDSFSCTCYVEVNAVGVGDRKWYDLGFSLGTIVVIMDHIMGSSSESSKITFLGLVGLLDTAKIKKN